MSGTARAMTAAMKRNLLMDIAIGAAAGAAATWLMDTTTTAIQKQESEQTRRREHLANRGTSSFEAAAKKLRRNSSERDQKRTGQAIHWAVGITAGAVYGAARNSLPAIGVGSGLVFGLGVWLAMDETLPVALGLTAPPQRFPWQAHARGLAGHLVLGAVVEMPFDGLELLAA